VVGARNFMSEQFTEEIKLAINSGGVAAFYHFLLSYDLSNFDAYTQPLHIQAKSKIIDYGMPGWEVFYREWKGERVKEPYCSCVTEDLHGVYLRWCDKAHE
jgi:putative DNA primase/helicase